jgi:hypothetical protein
MSSHVKLKDKIYKMYSKNLCITDNFREKEVKRDSKCSVFHFTSRTLMWINNEYFRWCNRSGSWRILATELQWVHRHMSPQVTTKMHGQMAWLILLQSWMGISNVSKNGSHALPEITGWSVVQYEACLRELLCDVSKGVLQDVWLSSSIHSVCKFYKHIFFSIITKW